MTKKEFIWLGIRVIGFSWLFGLILNLITLSWIAGYTLILKINGDHQTNLALTCLSSLMYLPVNAFVTLYFLLGGKLIYKFINYFTKSRSEDMTRPTGYCYCEVIVRFVGLGCIGMVLNKLYLSLSIKLQSVISLYLTNPEYLQKHGCMFVFRDIFNLASICILAFWGILIFFVTWYFLKHGKFFINLLNRVWLKATGSNSKPIPADPVSPA